MVNKTSRVLGLVVLILGLLVFSLKTRAQIVQRGNNFVEQRDTTPRGQVTKTKYTYTCNDVTDTIYLSSNGNAFIFKVSKKTGKTYRKYLPEVTERLGTKKENGTKSQPASKRGR